LRLRLEASQKPEVVARMHQAVDELRNSGASDQVLKVGNIAPDFVLLNADERPVDSKALLAHGPLVLTFYPGRWWPYCNAALVALEKVLPETSKVGASLVAISPQLPVYNRELIRHRHLTFEILSDRGDQLAARFGLRWALPGYLRDVYQEFPLDLEKFNGD